MASGSKALLWIEPNQLRFPFEAKKQISCSMMFTNRTDRHIALKVKNNNPRRYCVLPNISIVPPRSTCDVNVTMGAQSEALLGMQCDDKFLVQSVVVSKGTTLQDLTQENEVNHLRKFEHTNIVRLVGFCYETQPSQKRHEGKFVIAWDIACLLCLEYLPKGSLDKYISDACSGLDWPTRLKIIEGVSYGLQYLHDQSDGSVMHLDLKPANILLDENMKPKITDFGLSRLFDQEQIIQTSITRGTLGYMSPEYLRGIITPMSDIFSLGVLIMEVITGHRDYRNDIRASSKEFIEIELQKWRSVLRKEPGYTSLEADCEKITKCIRIGLICVNPERTRRPTMKKIIDMLEGLETMDWYIRNELTSLSAHVT